MTRAELDVKSGWAFHVHHDQLMQWCTNYEERVDYIRKEKPRSEQSLRLRLFKLIPPDRIPDAFHQAWVAYNQARVAYGQALVACDQPSAAYDLACVAYRQARVAYDQVSVAYDQARDAFHQAWVAYRQARVAYDQARDAYDQVRDAYAPYMEALHAELCPNCPWDGFTIFGEAKNDPR